MLVVYSSLTDAGAYRIGRNVCAVCPVTAFDVGLQRRRDLRRQLAVDLPRSHVHDHNGTRIVDVTSLHTPYPRFCTQCCMAPVVEWLHRSGIMAIECGSPLTVHVDRRGHLTCKKRLAVARMTSGNEMPNLDRTVCATIHVGDGLVLVSVHSSHGGRETPRRDAWARRRRRRRRSDQHGGGD